MARKSKVPKEPMLLISDSAGIYIPKEFAEGFDMRAWHVDEGDEVIIAAGPEEEWYLEAWEDVLNSAWTNYGGRRWTLYQDGDLWAIPAGFDFEKAGWL